MIVQNAADEPTAQVDVSEGMAWLVDQIGPNGVLVLLAVGSLLLLKAVGKTGRRALYKGVTTGLAKATRSLVRYVRITLWAARMRMSIRLAYRLQPERWREMCQARKLIGLKRGKVKRTPMGVDVRVTLGGSLDLETLNARIRQLETGLGTRRGAIRIEGGDSAHKAIVRITVRNPLAKAVSWLQPAGPVSITEPARLSMNAFGEWTEVDLQQRILVIGASGSGKSSTQRVLAAAVILAEDADLEVWDLKQGTESQHYEGKAILRITNAADCKARIKHLREVEIPRRAALMQKLGTSTWPTSTRHRDRIVMVDEGAALIRELDDEERDELFTFLEQARAYGIYLWWATQFPKSTNLPTELRSQMSCVIALKMRRGSESRVVFEELTKEGWTPHRLPGKGWLMVLDDDHDEPEESRAAFIDEKQFRALKATLPEEPEAVAVEPQLPQMPAYAPTIPQQAVAPVSFVKDEPEEAAVVPSPEELPTPDAVRTALADAPAAGLSAANLQLVTGRGKTQVYAAIQQLQDDGDVVKLGHGRYALASTEAGEVTA